MYNIYRIIVGGAMKYDLLKKEFSHLSSFLYWDNKDIENGLPKILDDEKFRANKLKSPYIFLALNIRKDNEELKNLYKSFKSDAMRDIFSRSSLRPWWLFHNLG